MDLSSLEHSHFEPLLGSKFHLHSAAGTAELKLVEIRPLGREVPGSRRSFSLLFELPEKTRIEQGTYRFEHAALGMLELFTVPVVSSAPGLFAEVIFN
jgi:hypothetical protein